jgi:TRAP-type C4-dicarboxylate transport system permease small subunit
LLVFAMIWLVMVGLVLVTAARRNIALDFLVARAGPRARTTLAIIHHAILTIACGYAAVQSFAFVRRLTALEQTSMALGMPMAIAHSALIVGFGGAMIVGALLVAGELAALRASRRSGGKGLE